MVITHKKFYGLVLTGGKSKRMGQDKALLKINEKTQAEYACDLLSEFCAKVFVSCRPDQTDLPGRKGFPQIHDKPAYSEIGPLAGILSAMEEFPRVPWIILGCDLPFVTKSTLEKLIKHQNPAKFATAYISTSDGMPEPLCAIYEPADHQNILNFVKQKICCPRKIMINSKTELIIQDDPKSLKNINTPEDLIKYV